MTTTTLTDLTVERGLRLVAGLFVVLSVLLGVYVSPWFFAFTAFGISPLSLFVKLARNEVRPRFLHSVEMGSERIRTRTS